MEHHQVHYPGGGTGDGPRPSDRSICQLPQARAEDYADAAAPALSAARRHGGPQLADDALRQLRHHQPVPEGTGPAGVQLVHGHKNGLRHDPADRRVAERPLCVSAAVRLPPVRVGEPV